LAPDPLRRDDTFGTAPDRRPDDGPATPRVRLRRHAERAHYDRATIDAILDSALVCHLGVVVDGEPLVLPTGFGRVGDTLYLHGAAANAGLRAALTGACLTVTHVDGLVMARSLNGHSMNFRSVVVRGRGRLVTDPQERLVALRSIVEHAVPGRWDEAREPSARELAATAIVAIPLAEVSAKVRTGPPQDPEDDRALPVWAGELPLRLVADAPMPDPGLAAGIPEPPSLAGLRRRFAPPAPAGS
jgi:nitroimidazol reductase NimA-like FMN-containing flavoprotein (pyridoxamine 5'-phosphate oxidase superfamily)